MTGFVWLASYPKSGSTWLRLALASIQAGGAAVDFRQRLSFAPVAGGRAAFEAVLGIESSDLSPAEILALRPRVYEILAREAPEPQFRKVHDAWCLTPDGEPLFPPAVTLGILHVVRDPRDVAVSLAAHIGQPLDEAIAWMADPLSELNRQVRSLSEQLPLHFGSWSSHAAGWRAAEGRRPPLMLRYEDMLADLGRELRRVLAYLDWTVPDAAVDGAVAATRFDALRAAEEQDGFRERPTHMERFFRQGVAGGWRAVLTRDQQARIEAAHGAMMRELGYL